MASWEVEFYLDARGRDPVGNYIRALPAKEQAKALRGLDLLEAFGPKLQQPHARHIEGALWELRPGPNRLFYFLYTGQRIIILHAYRKKGQKAPRKEINTALRRMSDWLERDQDGRQNNPIFRPEG